MKKIILLICICGYASLVSAQSMQTLSIYSDKRFKKVVEKPEEAKRLGIDIATAGRLPCDTITWNKDTLTTAQTQDTLNTLSADGIIKFLSVKVENCKMKVVFYDRRSCCFYDTLSLQMNAFQYFTWTEWNDRLTFAPVTVPFKIRFHQDTIAANAQADFKTIGLFIGKSRTNRRFFFDSTVSVHSKTIGGFIAPTIVSLNSSNTKKRVTEATNQLAISIGAAYSYLYDKIHFMLAAGIDIGTAKESNAYWIYNSKPWVGFGIGFDTAFLSF